MPYWHHEIDVPKTATGTLPKQADICIIGGGFTGLSVAIHLLKAGKSVVIVDAMRLGEGASGKNGGMIGPSLHKLGLEGLKNIHGEQKAYDILQEGINAIEYFPTFLKEFKIECDLNMSGRFNGVHNQKQLDEIEKKCEVFSKLKNFKYQMVAPDKVHSEIGSDHYYGGAVYELDGSIHPYKLLKGMVENIHKLGGQIFENTRADDIIKTTIGHNVYTDKGTLVAGEVVIATNGYSKQFGNSKQSYFYKRVIPLTSAMIATEEISPDLMQRFFPKNRIHGGNHRLVQYYRPSPDFKRILFGARGADFKDRADKNGQNLKKLMVKIFPEMLDIKLDFSWSGKVAYTFDHGPHLGKHDGLYYAMGYCGSGVTRSVYLAKKLSMQILGEENFQTEFHALEFQTKPFYNGKPWFMPFVIKWHSFMDGIE